MMSSLNFVDALSAPESKVQPESAPRSTNRRPGKGRKPQRQARAALNERVQFLFASLLGQVVVVHVTSGHVYEGLLYAYNTKSSMAHQKHAKLLANSNNHHQSYFSIVLRSVRRKAIKPKDFDTEQKLIDVFEVASWDILQIVAKDVMFATEVRKSFREDSFRTDTQISHHANHSDGRELIKWEGDAKYDPLSPDFVGELNTQPRKSSSKPFDQYAANAKYGIKSTYDENLYTTPLDKSDPELVRQAAKHAQEIEKSKFMSDNIHVREDRGLHINDDEFDEEQRYSTVIRDTEKKPSRFANQKPPQKSGPPAAAGAYVLPHMRNHQNPPSAAAQETESNAAAQKQQPDSKQEPAPSTTPEEKSTPENQPSKDAPKTEPQDQKTAPSAAAQEKKPGALNPNAKAFQFNPNAKPFTPGAPSQPQMNAHVAMPPNGYPAAYMMGAPHFHQQAFPPPYHHMPPSHYHGMPPFGAPPNFAMGAQGAAPPHAQQQQPQPQQQTPNSSKHVNSSMQQTFHQQHPGSPQQPQDQAPQQQPHRAPRSMNMPHDKKTTLRTNDQGKGQKRGSNQSK